LLGVNVVSRIESSWTRKGLLAYLLWPISKFYMALLSARRMAYSLGWKKTNSVSCPVIVVGNLSLGGTGKTPLCAYLVAHFQQAGWSPGIVSRGYGGHRHEQAHLLTPHDDPRVVGDEPLMLAQETGVPVCVCINRAAAVEVLAQDGNVDIVFSDDGLQHLSMPRVAEIMVIDGTRGFGNGWSLPAGPLRGSLEELASVDTVAIQVPSSGDIVDPESNIADLHSSLRSIPVQRYLSESLTAVALSSFLGRQVHAVAGIGHPQRFFDSLEAAGLDVVCHPKSDHIVFTAEDVSFEDDLPVLVTAKDAVKLMRLCEAKDRIYRVNTRVRLSASLQMELEKLESTLSERR